MQLSEENIKFFQSFFKEKTGIILDQEKSYLLETRLIPIAKKFNIRSFDDYILKLRINNKDLLKDSLEAITTNETYFFRDIKPFDFFQKNTLKDIIAATPAHETINILSAACSSGQEAYTLAMILMENKFKLGGRDFKITGIDISSKMVEKARAGIFNQFEVQRGLPISYLLKYFNRLDENYWEIKNEVKEKCVFTEANLLDKLENLGSFECIFARNVLIYFDNLTKKNIVRNFADIMKKGASLYLGSSETNNILPDFFYQIPDFRSIYKRV